MASLTVNSSGEITRCTYEESLASSTPCQDVIQVSDVGYKSNFSLLVGSRTRDTDRVTSRGHPTGETLMGKAIDSNSVSRGLDRLEVWIQPLLLINLGW